MKSVAILGCGPAGLLVAHAAEMSGWDFRIYSRKMKSKLFGAQYLHQPIPNLECGAPKLVQYSLRGTPEDYRRKVYGNDWDGTVSPEDYQEAHAAWDIRLAYDHLWREYEAEIWDVNLQAIPDVYHEVQKGHDLVISTVPRKIWARPGDVFESQKVWALGDTSESDRVRLYRPPDFHVYCCGTDEHEWYRVSNIFGYCTMEWPGFLTADGHEFARHPPARGASIVEKPLRHNSTAASDFVHLGRYGAWEKGLLSSDAFYEAMKVFAKDKL